MKVPIYSNEAMHTKEKNMKRRERVKSETGKKKRAMSPKVARRFLRRNLWKVARENAKKSLIKRAALCVKVLKKANKEKRKNEKKKQISVIGL